MRVLAHISDLHFGAVKPKLVEGVLEDLTAISPDLAVVSGDLTQRAKSREYRKVRKFFDQIPFPYLVVPGNHDVPLYNLYKRFRWALKNYKRYIGDNLEPSFLDEEIAVHGINTARSLTWKNGRISVEQMSELYTRFCAVPQGRFKILVTHHPFLAPPERHKRLVGRAERALQHLEDCRLDMLLSGHFHQSYAGGTHAAYTTLDHSLLVIQAGTATSSRVRDKEKNAYNIIRIEDGEVLLSVRMWTGSRFEEVRQERYARRAENQWMLHPLLM